MELMKGILVDFLLSVRFLFISASQVWECECSHMSESRLMREIWQDCTCSPVMCPVKKCNGVL